MNSEGREANLNDRFVAALSVLNRVLDAHRGTPPYQRIIAECEEQLQGRSLGIEVHADESDERIDRFAVRFDNGLFEPVPPGQTVEGPVWKLSVGELEAIGAKEPQCASDPDELPWEWLRARVGVERV